MSGVPTVTKSGKKRIFYFDALRALAILAVIFFHSSKRIRALIMSYYSSPPNLHWIFGDFTFAGLVIGVCLFLMLSGALLINKKDTLSSFIFLAILLPKIIDNKREKYQIAVFTVNNTNVLDFLCAYLAECFLLLFCLFRFLCFFAFSSGFFFGNFFF